MEKEEKHQPLYKCFRCGAELTLDKIIEAKFICPFCSGEEGISRIFIKVRPKTPKRVKAR